MLHPVRVFPVIFLMLTLLLLNACASQPSSSSASHSPITIGGTVSRTGDFSSDGKLLEAGYKLWADDINKRGGLLGHQVELDIKDDASNPDQVTADYQKLISVDHVNLLFAPFSGDLTMPATRVALRYHYAMVEGAATEKGMYAQGFSNLFAVSLPAEHYLSSFDYFLLALPQAERPQTLAYVTSDDPFTQPQVDTARAELEAGHITTALYKTYGQETTDYSPLAAQIVHAHPDGVILGTQGVEDLSAFMKYFKEHQYNPKVLIATSGPDQGKQFVDAVGGLPMTEGTFVPNDGWYPGIKTYQNDQFEKEYVAAYGGTPDDISSDTVQAFSSGQVLEQAANLAHSLDNTKLMQTLRSNTFNSLQGPVKFDAQGRNTVSIAFLFQWQKGNLIPVYPESAAQANVEYPKNSWP